MLVFIGWSGERSQAMALILRTWLRLVVQAAEPWFSPVDIASGAPWSEDLQGSLREAVFAIVCVTPENHQNPWLNYECGHLAGRLSRNVCPLLLNIQPKDLGASPLSRQQARSSNDKREVRRLVLDLNTALGDRAVPEDVVDKAFERNWDDLRRALEAMASEVQHVAPAQTLDAKVDEILSVVWSIQRQLEADEYDSAQDEPEPNVPPEKLIDLFEALKKSLAESRGAPDGDPEAS